jgi:hypothetical protein
MTTRDPRLDAAWQAALAVEHQAVFGYDVLGPHLSAPDRPRARNAQKSHVTLRDGTEAAMTTAGLTPVAAQVDYPALYPVADAAAARRLAVRLEDDCAAAWRYLYLRTASTPSPTARRLRGAAQTGLTGSAIRAARWRALVSPTQATVAFPGL